MVCAAPVVNFFAGTRANSLELDARRPPTRLPPKLPQRPGTHGRRARRPRSGCDTHIENGTCETDAQTHTHACPYNSDLPQNEPSSKNDEVEAAAAGNSAGPLS